jgi:hypothetical protein
MLVGPLGLAASQVAHGLAYRLVDPNAEQRAQVLRQTGHQYLAYAPLAFAVLTVVATVAFAVQVYELIRSRQGRCHRPSPLVFAAVGPAIFCLQEHFERFAAGGGVPWSAALDRTFIVGLLLQIPTAAVAWVIARLILGIAEYVAVALRARPLRLRGERVAGWTPRVSSVEPCAILALGYPTRGPPLHLL